MINKLHFIGKVLWCIKKRFPLRLSLCDIPLWDIPVSTKFGHPYGITINEGTVIGENCSILSNVTIGQRNFENEKAVIGDNVWIGAGAIILGPVKVCNNAIIPAGAIILEDVLNDLCPHDGKPRKYTYRCRS